LAIGFGSKRIIADTIYAAQKTPKTLQIGVLGNTTYNMRHYMRVYDINIPQSFGILGGINYTTDAIRNVVVLYPAPYDTTRIYASFVLQVSNFFWLYLIEKF